MKYRRLCSLISSCENLNPLFKLRVSSQPGPSGRESREESKTYMHARPPPRKVILFRGKKEVRCRWIEQPVSVGNTHRLEYMPGIFASVTGSGSGESHRSGFQSIASSPQIALLRLEERRPAITTVSFGMRIWWIVEPSSPRIGLESGRTTS